MRYRATFVAGFAAGYVVGARAGRERYEQIKRTARRIADSPAVQEAAGIIQAQASEFAGTAKHKVGDKLQDRIPRLRPKDSTTYTQAPAGPNGAHTRH